MFSMKVIEKIIKKRCSILINQIPTVVNDSITEYIPLIQAIFPIFTEYLELVITSIRGRP